MNNRIKIGWPTRSQLLIQWWEKDERGFKTRQDFSCSSQLGYEWWMRMNGKESSCFLAHFWFWVKTKWSSFLICFQFLARLPFGSSLSVTFSLLRNFPKLFGPDTQFSSWKLYVIKTRLDGNEWRLPQNYSFCHWNKEISNEMEEFLNSLLLCQCRKNCFIFMVPIKERRKISYYIFLFLIIFL